LKKVLGIKIFIQHESHPPVHVLFVPRYTQQYTHFMCQDLQNEGSLGCFTLAKEVCIPLCSGMPLKINSVLL